MSQRAVESILVNAKPEALYELASDFANYPSWVADLKKVTIVAKDESGRPLDVEFRAAAFGRSSTYTLRYNYDDAPTTLRWSQVSSDLTTTLNGSYTFTADGSGTRVAYELEVELFVPIPNFVKNRAASRIQTQALRELKARAESRP